MIIDETSINEGRHTTRWLIGPWNSQSTLDFGIAFLHPDQQVKPHLHERVEEIFYIIEGQITLILDRKEITLKPGIVAYIPPKMRHALHNRSATTAKLVCVKSPSLPSDKKYIE
jgi:mannose-6-phosphate isomerase-like protein (cupin superfamily)